MADLTQEERMAIILGKATPPPKEEPAPEKTDEGLNEGASEGIKEPEFDFGVFEKKFGRKIEKEDDLKTLFEKADKHEELKKSYSETVEKLNEYKGLAEKLDPLANFLNEDEYKRQQLLIQKQGKLSEDAVKSLSVLTPNKVKELSDVEALKIDLMIAKDLTSKEAEDYLLNKYGIEDFGDDMEERTKTVIKVDAKDARKEVLKLYEGISVPTKTDYEAARTQLKQSWERTIPEIVKSIDKIQIAEGIDFVVTDDMKKGMDAYVESLVLSKQIKPSEAAGAEILGHLKDEILIRNIGNVVKSMENDLREKIKAETRAYLHNDKPLDEGNRGTETQLDNDAKVRKLLN